MNDVERRATMQREKGRGLVRALHLSELQAAGAARDLALHEAEQQLDRIAKVLPDALGAGMSMSEVARVTGVSRPTLYELRGRYADRDLTHAVFQTIANRGRARQSDLVEHVGRPWTQIQQVLTDLLAQGMLEEDFNEDQENPAMELWLTEAGFDALEHYKFAEDEPERES
jgi:predicted transcriptional regulator